MAKLHYDKEKLLTEYRDTYKWFVAATFGVVALALVYFFVMASYLGGTSHTPHTPFVEQFVKDGRIDPSTYEGLKAPVYEQQVDPDINADYHAAEKMH